MSDEVLVHADDGLTTITLNRPDALNALDTATKVALLDAVTSATTDDSCRAILLTGTGPRAFCVGQDLREHVHNLAGDDPLATVREHYNPIARALFHTDKPVVAAVRGAAAGAGASLAFLADVRIGGPSTKFTMAFAAIGLAADTGAGYTLPRLVGHDKATQMMLFNETVRAEEAARIGLLSRLVDSDDDVEPTAREAARELAHGPTLAFAQIKAQLRSRDGFDTALDGEAAAQAACGFSADHAGAVDAFVNKRKPVFKGQ